MRCIRALAGVEYKLPCCRRQCIGPLCARPHDKAKRVMQVIKQAVGFGKPRRPVRREMPGRFKPFNYFACALTAAFEQVGMYKAKPPHQKIDLANPARLFSKLPGRRVAIAGAHTLPHVIEGLCHVVGRNRRGENLGCHLGHFVGQRRFRCHNPCLRQCQLFPQPCFVAVVIRQPVQPRCKRAFFAIRAEPCIDAEQYAFAGGAAEPACHGLSQPGEIAGGAKCTAAALSSGRRLFIRRIPDKDKIEVGCGGEVALAEPAHGEDQNIPLDCAVAAFHVGARKITDDTDHRLGPVGQCASDRAAVDNPAQPLHLGPESALARLSCDDFQRALDRHVTDAVPQVGLETVGIR